MAASNDQLSTSGHTREWEGGRPLRVILVMILVLAAAGAVAMWRIDRVPPPPIRWAPGWSPLGYTYSLALFALPILALGIWFSRWPKDRRRQWQALGLTLAVFGPLWCAVDVLLANRFFRFPNASAHIEPMFWGYTAGEGFARNIPYEEFFFYFGAVSVLVLLYAWGCETWYSRYTLTPEQFVRDVRRSPPLVTIHWRSAFWGVATLATALLYKKFGPHPYGEGLPEYFLLLWGLAVVPTVLLTKRMLPFINSRALLFTVMAALLVSLLWEVTLALPNGWWNYHHPRMMGIFVGPWHDLPVEQLILWPASGWSNVLFYELFRVYRCSNRPMLELLFGRRAS